MFLSLKIFTTSFLFNSFLIDLWSRINTNESLLNYYYFWWTNPWYIAILFFTILYIWLTFLTTHLFYPFRTLLIIFIFLYFLETQFFLVSNYSLFIINLNLSNFNTFLFNNFNKYHPFILYSTAAIFLITSLTFVSILKSNFYFSKTATQTNYFNFNELMLLFFSSISLFLGSWWASQEASWGGWWNWDSSETLGLLLLIYISLLVHFVYTKIPHVNNYYFNLFFSLFVFASYFFIQLNFDLSSHNFGIKFFFFFNNNFFFIEIIYCIFTLFFLFFFKKKFHKLFFFKNIFFLKTKHSLFSYNNLIRGLVLSLIFLTVALSVFFSYSDIINFFFWSTFGFNISNNEPSFDNLSYFFLIYFTIFFLEINSIPAIYAILFICKSLWLFLLLFNIDRSRFTTLHFFLILFILLIIVSQHTESLNFSLISEHLDFLNYDILNNFLVRNFSINFFFYEIFSYFYVSKQLFVSWFLDNTLVPFNNTFFNLVSSNNFFLNIIKLSDSLNYALFLNDVQSLQNLLPVFLIFIVLFSFSFFFNNKKIKNI